MKVTRSPTRSTSTVEHQFHNPLQPDEISHLASSLDDVLDYIDSTTRKMDYYEITEVDRHYALDQADPALGVIEIEQAVKCIRSIKDPMQIEKRCIEVNRFENVADDVLAHAIKDISFKTKGAVDIISTRISTNTVEIAIHARTWQTSFPILQSGIPDEVAPAG